MRLASPNLTPGIPNGIKLSTILKTNAIASKMATIVSFLIRAFVSINSPNYDLFPTMGDYFDKYFVVGADDRMIRMGNPTLMDAFLPRTV